MPLFLPARTDRRGAQRQICLEGIRQLWAKLEEAVNKEWCLPALRAQVCVFSLRVRSRADSDAGTGDAAT
jgi:hypothetical protein